MLREKGHLGLGHSGYGLLQVQLWGEHLAALPKTSVPSSFSDSPCHPSSPLCLLSSSFSSSSILSHRSPPTLAWPLMGVCPPTYLASPSLTNIMERIHTCPERLLCQHQFACGMCKVSPHLHLFRYFKTVSLLGAAEQRDKRCSGERGKGARFNTHHGQLPRLSATCVTPVH